jgi:transketolase
MRNAFIDELVSAAEINHKIALVVGDLGYGVIEPFATRFPNRFFNAGVAEQNMMGMAAGLASEGFHVFVYSIANFPLFRCAEQIRNDVDYHQLPVTIVSVGGGVAYGNLGYSHHAIQDYALIRSFPNMLIGSPGDPMEVRAVMRYLVSNPQPSYLRLGKAGEISLHKQVPMIYPGKWVEIPIFEKANKEFKTVYLTTGTTLIPVSKIIGERDVVLRTLPLWGMKYKTEQLSQFSQYKSVVTFEDHLLDGGFGSWLLEALHSQGGDVNVLTIKALNPSICGMVGAQESLLSAGELFK